ncbi:hypothetical protein BDV12DRAFT_195462 [Aspergillus spectabilis]
MTTKASHLLTQTARRKYPLFILLFTLLIIIYPFTTTFLPGLPEIPLTPSDPLAAQPPLPPSSQSSASATDLSAYSILNRPISHDKTTIPKIIHQTWFPAGSNMSSSAKSWVATVKKFHPDWEYVLWDDGSNEKLVREYFPWFLETYKSLPKEINRADMARNFYMFLFGGMYADVDTEALRPVETLFASHDVSLDSHQAILSSATSSTTSNSKVQRAFMGRMAHTLDPEGLGAIPNGWMASPPGHPFWLLPVLSVLENPKGDGSVEGMTGPGILGPLIKQYFGNGPSQRSALRRQLCTRIQNVQAGWDLFCDDNEEGLKHSLVLLPREQIYPYSWADDGDVKVCLGAKSNPGFEPEALTIRISEILESKFFNMYAKPAASRPWNIIFCTLNWILWSNLTILFNKWILESTPFRYPILLTTWHLLFATLATQLLARTTTLLNGRKSIKMTPKLYISRIAPIGVLYSGSLVCSNMAYLYLNVGFVQMIKASGPVITLLTSSIYSVTTLSISKVMNILFITGSVALTVSGEIQFSWVGVAIQVLALVLDANRLVLLQMITSSSSSSSSSPSSSTSSRIVISERDDEESVLIKNEEIEKQQQRRRQDEEEHEQELTGKPTERETLGRGIPKMDPLLSLYYSAPICAVMNAILAWKGEVEPLLYSPSQAQAQTTDENYTGDGSSTGTRDLLEITLSTGLGVLFLNACVGFMLNVAVFTLIGKTSGLTMTLVSIPKNILLILASVVIWGTRVSALQWMGYVGALGGLVFYSGGGDFLVKGVRGVLGKLGIGKGGIRGRYGRVPSVGTGGKGVV